MRIEGIYNYYENLVHEEIMRFLGGQEQGFTADDMEDIACLALNHLPAKYVRHSVDTVYFQTPEERKEMNVAVVKAVRSAFDYIKSHPSVRDSA